MFEFWSKNLITTTTMISITSNNIHLSKKNLIDRNAETTWVSDGFISDTATIITISFSTPVTITGIFLINHNIHHFSTNSGAVISGGGDFLSQSGNYEKRNTYFIPSSATGIGIYNTQFHIKAYGHSGSSNELHIGEIIACKDRIVRFNPPEYNNYINKTMGIGLKRQLLDGGIINIRNSSKKSFNMSLLVNTSTQEELKNLWDQNTNFIFIPFPVTLSGHSYAGTDSQGGFELWDGTAEHLVWSGDFELNKLASNNLSNGYTGMITLNQIPD